MKGRMTVKRNVEKIHEMFDKIESKGIIGSMKKKWFKSKFLNKSYALFKMVKRVKWAGDVVKDERNLLVVEENGTKEYLKERKEKLEQFLDGSKNQVRDMKEVKEWESDRTINKILSKLRRGGKWLKDKSMKKVLEGRTLRSFFLSAGITFDYEIRSSESQ